jgi:outer membrane receptor for monomeric catechols
VKVYIAPRDTTGTVPNAENIGYRLNVIAEGGDSYRDHVESKRYGIAPSFNGKLLMPPKLLLKPIF